MLFEKRWFSIAPRLFVANGTAGGQITLADTAFFKVKQKVAIVASGEPNLELEVKAVLSDTILIVGPIGDNIYSRTNISAYTTGKGSFIYAQEQIRPGITQVEHHRAVFDEEPTVAYRSVLVDKYGRYNDLNNPLYVQLTDGSVNIGTVNAELEVQLSHKDNYPDPGDVNDSVRVGDGVEELAINPDGSINVVSSASNAATPTIANIDVVLASTEYSYALPTGTKHFTLKDREGNAKTRIAYVSGDTNAAFTTVNMGVIYEVNDVSTLAGLTIYFQSSKPSRVIEIESWN